MKRNYAIDLIKFIAAFFVVCIHTKTTSHIDGFEVGSFSYIIDNIARFAVPFFFAASGLFIDFNNKHKLAQRLFWILVIYLFWSLVFIVIRKTNGLQYPVFYLSADNKTNYYLNTAYKLLVYGYERHLWFFPAYIIGVLMVLLLKKSKAILAVSAIILYLLGLTGHQWSFIYPQQLSFLPQPTSEWLSYTHLTRSGLFLGFPFMALGYLSRRDKYAWNIPIFTIPTLVILFFLQYLEGAYLFRSQSTVTAESYLTTIPIVYLLLLIGKSHSSAGQKVFTITRLSGGIYLLHPVFMYLFFIYLPQVFTYTWWDYIYTPILFFISILLAYLLSKNKWLRQLIFSN